MKIKGFWDIVLPKAQLECCKGKTQGKHWNHLKAHSKQLWNCNCSFYKNFKHKYFTDCTMGGILPQSPLLMLQRQGRSWKVLHFAENLDWKKKWMVKLFKSDCFLPNSAGFPIKSEGFQPVVFHFGIDCQNIWIGNIHFQSGDRFIYQSSLF